MKLLYDNCPNCFEPLGGSKVCRVCGYNLDKYRFKTNILAPFNVLNNRYLIGRALGQGGFGITYLAKDMEINSLCAIKEYMPVEYAARKSGSKVIAPTSADVKNIFENGRNKFINEARMLYKFSENPMIVSIYDYFKENNTAYLVMEYLDGVNLKTLASSYGGRIPVQYAEEVLVAVANALVPVHNYGILHRDISPENIFLTKNEEIKLIDFGAARDYINNQNSGMSVLLKPGFAPPEQYSRQGEQGPWTDIYALAATFYTVVSGQPLLDSMMLLRGTKQPKLSELNCGVSEELSNIIEKAMSSDYRMRYQSCEEFLNAIDTKDRTVHDYAPERRSIKYPGYSEWTPSPISERSATGRQREAQEPYNALIELIEGQNRHRIMKIQPGKLVNIGRSSRQSNFVIETSSDISRVHCMVEYDNKNACFYVTDVSANGTYFQNGKRMVKGQKYLLKSGDSFYLATAQNMINLNIVPARKNK